MPDIGDRSAASPSTAAVPIGAGDVDRGGPLITIVIATFDRAHVLQRAIDSVRAQTMPRWELIVVDDGSEDETPSLLDSLQDPRIRSVRVPRGGAAAARNSGVRLGTAPYVTFLDSDDDVVPEWLETFMAAIAAADADIATSAYYQVDADGHASIRPLRDMGPIFDHQRGNFTHSGSWVTRRSVFLEIGGFAPRMAASQHTELAYRLLPTAHERGWSIVEIEQPLLRYHIGSADGIRGDDRAVLNAAEFMLKHHGHLLAREPARLAKSHGVAGFRAARVGDRRLARQHFTHALRANPRHGRSWMRLMLAGLWPLRPPSWRPSREHRSQTP